MSQHIIALPTPQAGSVVITAGFDPRLSETFVNYCGQDCEYVSGPGLRVEDINPLLQQQLQTQIPMQLLDAVRQDIADYLAGAEDIGRRVSRYDSAGTCIDSTRW